jgi:hypothetical protein
VTEVGGSNDWCRDLMRDLPRSRKRKTFETKNLYDNQRSSGVYHQGDMIDADSMFLLCSRRGSVDVGGMNWNWADAARLTTTR